MTQKQREAREARSQTLKVFEIGDGNYFVESAEGRVCYKVRVNDDHKLCTCDDFAENGGKDNEFVCKHLLAVINGNGNIRRMNFKNEKEKPKLDERFIIHLKGNEYVRYGGLLDLSHQIGLKKLTVEPVQFPTKENGSEAICKAIAESVDGEVYVDVGDANPINTNRMVANHILRIASTRAKARVLRDMTNISMTCLEELSDIDDVPAEGNGENGKKNQKTTSSKPQSTQPRQKKDDSASNNPPPENQQQPPSSSTSATAQPAAASKKPASEPAPKQENGGVPMFQAQRRAIENLAKRRNITAEELNQMVQQQYGTSFESMTSSDASSFIGYLQKSA